MLDTFDSLTCVDYKWSSHANFLFDSIPNNQKIQYLNTIKERISTIESVTSSRKIMCTAVWAKNDNSRTFNITDIRYSHVREVIEKDIQALQKLLKKHCEQAFAIFPEISFEDAILSYKKDHPHGYSSGQYSIRGPGDYSGSTQVRKYENYREVTYKESLYRCKVQVHYHILFYATDYKCFQEGSLYYREKSNISLKKQRGYIIDEYSLAATAQYLSKINVLAPKNQCRNHRFKFDLPVFNHETAEIRISWLKLLEPVHNFPTTYDSDNIEYLNQVIQGLETTWKRKNKAIFEKVISVKKNKKRPINYLEEPEIWWTRLASDIPGGKHDPPYPFAA